MIDIHCHLLPGLDDGVKTEEEAIECLRIAEEDGIRTLVMTPHISEGVYDVSADAIRAAAAKLRERAGQEGIDIDIRIGSDNHLSADFIQKLQEGKILSLNETGKYILMELPKQIVPGRVHELLFRMRLAGYWPVLTHPERNHFLRTDLSFLMGLVRMGCLVQVTAASVEGEFGEEAEAASLVMLRRRMVHVIASDAHSKNSRPPVLSGAVERASEIVGEAEARKMVFDVPSAILQGTEIQLESPLEEKSFLKKIWSFFS